MKFSIRYSLREVLGLLTLVPLSTGLVYLADQASGAALDCLRPATNAIEQGVEATVGELSTSTRSFLLYSRIGISNGLLLSCLVVSCLLLRSYLATLVAFSLPFSMLHFTLLLLWISGGPITAETAFVLVEPMIIAAIVAACVLGFSVYCKRRLHGAEIRTKAAYSERPHWRKLLLTTAFVLYLLFCGYGWYGMVSFRTEMIEAREYWQRIEQANKSL